MSGLVHSRSGARARGASARSRVLLSILIAATGAAFASRYEPAGQLVTGRPSWLATDGLRLAWGDAETVHVEGVGAALAGGLRLAIQDSRDGAFAGARLYVVGPGEARLTVVELGTQGAVPEEVALEDAPRGPLAVAVMGDYLVVGGRDAVALYLMPPPPEHRMPAGVAGPGHHHAAGAPAAGSGRGHRLVARVGLPEPVRAAAAAGRRAYLLAGDGSRVRVLTAVDLRAPRVSAAVPLPEAAHDLAINGARLYVLGDAGLRVVRLFDGTVAGLGPLDASVRGRGIGVTGRMLRVAGGAGLSTFIDTSPLAAIHEVNVANFFFDPADLSIAPGDTVRWTNTMGFHNVSSCSGQPSPNVCAGETADEFFRSGEPAFNPWTFEHTFTVVGRDPYHCEVHNLTMRGTITVDAPPGPPPAVPDGSDGAASTARKLDAAGTTIEVDWDAVTCPDAQDHQLVWGFGSQLPSAPGGILDLSGAECAIGSPPYTWSMVPDPTVDSTRLVWWLLLATDAGTTEGSWGVDSAGSERNGPDAGGSSGQCGITAKDVTNTCGL